MDAQGVPINMGIKRLIAAASISPSY